MLRHPTTRLGSIARIIMGQSPPGTTYNEAGEGLPFYQGVVDFGSRYPSRRVYCTAPTRIAEPGDILFSVRAPIGRVNIATEHCSIGRSLAVVRPHDPNDRVFVEFVLRAGTSHLWDMFEGGGSVFGNARRDDLESLEIVWPAIQERCAIAAILGALDDKIELNRQMNQTLEAMARALFKSWFVDFKPFRDGGMEESPLGPIPRGWRMGTVNNIAVLRRQSITPSDFPNEFFDHYSIPAFDEGRMPKVVKGEQIKSNKFEVPNKAVLISKLNPRFPRVWLPSIGSSRRSVSSTEFLVALPKENYTPEYIYSLFGSASFFETFSTLVTGTSSSHQRVRPEDLLTMDTIISPKEATIGFTDAVRPSYERVKRNLYEASTLAAICDTLLPKLLSGEIRVTDAERFVEEKI